MDFQDLEKKTDTDLRKLLLEKRSRLQELQFKLVANQVKDVREVRTLKKDIARLLTKLTERAQVAVNEPTN